MQREVLEHEHEVLAISCHEAPAEAAEAGLVQVTGLHGELTGSCLHMEAVLAVNGELDLADVTGGALAFEKFIFAGSAYLTALGGASKVFDDGAIARTLRKIMVLDKLSLLGEEEVVVDRRLHDVAVELFCGLLVLQRVEGERLTVCSINVEHDLTFGAARSHKVFDSGSAHELRLEPREVDIKDSDHAEVAVGIGAHFRREQQLAALREDQLQRFKATHEVGGKLRLSVLKLEAKSFVGFRVVDCHVVTSDEGVPDGGVVRENLDDASASALEWLLVHDLSHGVELGDTFIRVDEQVFSHVAHPVVLEAPLRQLLLPIDRLRCRVKVRQQSICRQSVRLVVWEENGV